MLLDEPGLNLHAKAQNDLLRYSEERLDQQHQVIYSTHSLFMIQSSNWNVAAQLRMSTTAAPRSAGNYGVPAPPPSFPCWEPSAST